MNLNWKFVLVAVSAALLMGGSGCSGINSSGSVSPATFLLPGLIRVEPQPADQAAPLPEPAPSVQVAQVR